MRDINQEIFMGVFGIKKPKPTPANVVGFIYGTLAGIIFFGWLLF